MLPRRWSLARVGNCAHPIRLRGHSDTIHAATGEVVDSYRSDAAPLGVIHVRCGNRRAAVCPSCSRLYAADMFHLIRAGVVGGKTVPESVGENPLVFATLTAPSFGVVHGRRDTGQRCHPHTRGPAWSSISIARAYPTVHIEALDVDEASIAAARENVANAGLSERIHPHVLDGSSPDWPGRYDVVTIFEALHDMNRPVAALRIAREHLTEGGCVLVADEKVGERFTPNGDDLERFNYGWSVLHCPTVGMLDPDSAGTGTVLRPDTLRGYATEAGFSHLDVQPIDNEFWRFYRLIP